MSGYAPPLTRWVVADRQQGKTTALMEWLAAGHPVDGWPGWSRLVVVPTVDELLRITNAHRDVDRRLRDRGCPGGLGKVLLGPSDVLHDHSMRGLDVRAVQFGGEGAAMAVALRRRGIRPAVVTLDGVAITPAELLAEARHAEQDDRG